MTVDALVSAASDWRNGALLGLAHLALLLAAEAWTRRAKPDPELARKAVHFAAGVGALGLPWLIRSPWMVAGLGAFFAAIVHFGQRQGWLRCLAVERRGAGGAYFPMAVLLLFVVGRTRPWLYVASLLVVTVADAAAALVGGAYGRHRFRVGDEDSKSLEGSLSFLLLTFFALQLPMLLLGGLPPMVATPAALLVALLLTGIEAVSTRGTDNLWVPLLAAFALLRITTKPVAEIAFQLGSLLAMLALLEVVFRRLKFFTIRDSIVFSIFAYGVWSLGSARWSVPVFACFLLYSGLRALVPNERGYVVATAPLLRVLLAPLLLLLAANVTGFYRATFGPFLAAVGSAFACVSWAYLLHNRPATRGRGGALRPLLAGAVLCATPVAASLATQEGAPVLALAWIPGLAGLGLLAYDRHLRGRLRLPDRGSPVVWIALAVAAAAWGLQESGALALWNPGG